MAQPNTAREPSMDEILASIRKIIESNEPGIPGFPANDLGPAPEDGYRSGRAYDDDRSDDIHLTIDEDGLVAEFEAEEHQRDLPAEPREPANARPVQSTLTPPLSLADVAARVRAASERHSAPLREPENTSGLRARADNPMVTARMAPVTNARMEPLIAALPHQAEGTAEPVSVPASVSPSPISQLNAATKEKTEKAAPAVEAAEERRPLAIVAEKDVAAIVSPGVSEQVARSFGDLTLALDNSARRSFDEIAEDMLRPMLQEWLDDNLPTLVERLVREEIERVARGPRR